MQQQHVPWNPASPNPILGALLFPQDIQVENRRLLSALANSVNNLGVKVITGTNVDSLMIERNRLTGVQTSGGVVSCSTAVVAAGTWSTFIKHVTFSIEPVRGQMVCLEAIPQLTRHVIFSRRGYIVPRRDGRLLAGSTSEHAGFAKCVTAGGVSYDPSECVRNFARNLRFANRRHLGGFAPALA